MSSYANLTRPAIDTDQQPREARRKWFTLNGGLWALQILWGFFFAGSGFGKVLLYDSVLYAEAPRAVAWYAAVSQPLIVFIEVFMTLSIAVSLPILVLGPPDRAPS